MPGAAIGNGGKMPNNLPIVAVDSHAVNTSVKRLRQNSHTTLYGLLRRCCPCFGPSRLSTWSLRHPIFVLSFLIIVIFTVFLLIALKLLGLSNAPEHDPVIDVNDIRVIRDREYALTSSMIPEAEEIIRSDINAPLTPLRIVLTVPPFEPTSSTGSSSSSSSYSSSSFATLISSMRNAKYDQQNVNLHVLLLPSDDAKSKHTTYKAAASISWPHGKLSLQNATTSGLLASLSVAWGPSRGAMDAVALIDASRAQPLSSLWYKYANSARVRFGHRADIIAFCVETVRPRGEDAPSLKPKLPDGVTSRSVYEEEPMDPDVFMWQGVEDSGVLIPSSVDQWRAFLRWLQQQRSDWFMWPSVIGLRDKRDERWDHFRATVRADWPLWLSRFSALYDVYTLYPRNAHPGPLPLILDDGEQHHQHSSSQSEKHSMLRNKRIVRLALDGSVVRHGVDSRIEDSSVHRVVELGRKHGGVVSLTVINRAFLMTARSWICNVDVGGFRPPGVVWITTDDDAYEGLKDVDDSVAIRIAEMRGAKQGTRFGSPGYWLLMLERTTLIRDILQHGIGVFAFETDQVWLRDPVPFVDRVVSGGGDDVDIVGTVDSSHDIAGNFLFLRPTLATRKLWGEVSKRFEHAYTVERMSELDAQARIIIENDQTLLTKLTLFDSLFRAKFPVVFRALDTELFVSGRWYDGGKRFYTSRKSRSPIMINNNFIEGIKRKTLRLKRHVHWFLSTDGRCDAARVRRAIEQNEKRADQAGLFSVEKEQERQEGNKKKKLGRVIVGVDSKADLEMAITALNSEREDDETKLTLQPKNDGETEHRMRQKRWAVEAAAKWYDEVVVQGLWKWRGKHEHAERRDDGGHHEERHGRGSHDHGSGHHRG